MTEHQAPYKTGHWSLLHKGDGELLLVLVADGSVDVIATTSKASEVDVATFQHIAQTMNRLGTSTVAMSAEIVRLRGLVNHLKDAIRSATAECDCAGVSARLLEALAVGEEK